MEFGSWEVFTNDEHTRSFLSLEIVAMGNPEVRVLDCKQLSAALFFFFASEFNNLIYFWYWFPIVNVMHKLGRQLSVFQLMNSCFWFADQETSVPC
jgi:hypothetical protein